MICVYDKRTKKEQFDNNGLAVLNECNEASITEELNVKHRFLNAVVNNKKDFEIVFDYIYRRLFEANIKKDAEILEEALGYIREMRDTWKEVMKLAKK